MCVCCSHFGHAFGKCGEHHSEKELKRKCMSHKSTLLDMLGSGVFLEMYCRDL